MSNCVRLESRFEGRVQGVGFRYTTCQLARSFDITGYVANRQDGSVELVVEGARPDIESFLEAIEQSRLSATIRRRMDRWLRPRCEDTGFVIRHDVEYGL